MMNFNVGAPRRANDDARQSRIDAANDLVQRTLAQHGLTAPAMDRLPGGMPSGLPSGLPGGLTAPPRRPAANVPVPKGAQFLQGTHSSAAGARSFRTYVPASAAQGVQGAVTMLHGCTQTAEDFAIGTGMNALAEAHRLIVIYPQQSRGDNAQSCWNWFSAGDQRRGRGEPEILAGLTQSVLDEHAIAPECSFVAGLSAGAAMAVILGAAYGDTFAAVGAHSGLPLGAARDVPSAFAAMAGNGPEPGSAGAAARTIIFHGAADSTVHPMNGVRIAQQALASGARQTIDEEARGTRAGRGYTRRIVTAGGAPQLEHWTIDGLGHAWSGGQPGGSYTDARGPDASAEMIRFFLNHKDL
ncbi:esterase [Pelagivirga sediminicola]|uniref:Esterase n=1 Tax=Pelagivirga sediminicola TaxID=2170575 RepID=A0A2T7GC46_9RHOB|nr:PHB depolymerase family esterase [Pelagivirga sediminicola]PVA11987.1 esterase [Pelagivirga sediminicola]